jgi:hypothetical protein
MNKEKLIATLRAAGFKESLIEYCVKEAANLIKFNGWHKDSIDFKTSELGLFRADLYQKLLKLGIVTTEEQWLASWAEYYILSPDYKS